MVCEALKMEEELLANQDSARISPKVFLKIRKCIIAIQKEFDDPARPGHTRIPSLIAVSTRGSKYRALGRARTTVVANRKNPELYKDRMCIRGDQSMGRDEFASSAPTDSREIHRLIISLSCVM